MQTREKSQSSAEAVELAKKHLMAKIERENGDLHKTGLPEVEFSKEKIRQIRENPRLSQNNLQTQQKLVFPQSGIGSKV